MTGEQRSRDQDDVTPFGKTTIRLCVNDESELYKKFSLNNEINPEIIEYLESEVDGVSIFDDLFVEAFLRQKDGTQKPVSIEKPVRAEAAKRAAGIDAALGKLRRQAAGLAVGGLIPLAIYEGLSFRQDRMILKEFFLIMAWVFIWKAVELFFFNRPELLKRKIRLKKIVHAGFSHN